MTAAGIASPGDQRKPKPLLALAGSLAMPGLGQLYLGDPVRGALFLVGAAFAVPCAARLGLAAPPRLLCVVTLLGVAAAVGIYVWSAVDACRRAPRVGVVAPSLRRPGVYFLYATIAYALVLAPSTAYVRDNLLETFVVPSGSMTPTIVPGDRLLADKRVGRRGGVKLWRGAIAVFIYPNDRTSVFIKRVIGLPGDRIDIDGRRLRVNGKDVASDAGDGENTTTTFPPGLRLATERGDRGDYQVLWPVEEGAQGEHPGGEHSTGPAAPSSFVVPEGQVFVLGDNRAAAVDSRRFGTVPLTDIQAVARQVWFSSHRGAGVRWARIGTVLR
ncbi:MAG: signal peptidase I [Polyangia bacterium]